MEPLLAAAGRIVGYLVPIALGQVVELGKKLGQSAVQKIGKWLDGLRAQWANDGEASEVLKKFEKDPVENADALRDVLAERMQREDALKSSAEQLAKDIGPTVVVTMKAGAVEVQTGPEFGKVLRGTVTVDMNLATGKQQVGPKFGDIG